MILNIRVVKNVREGTAVAVPFHNIYYTMYTLHYLLTGVQALLKYYIRYSASRLIFFILHALHSS